MKKDWVLQNLGIVISKMQLVFYRIKQIRFSSTHLIYDNKIENILFLFLSKQKHNFNHVFVQ